MSCWTFTYEGFDPENEKLREALCTLGNGYFATRGAAAESEANGIHLSLIHISEPTRPY